MSNPTKASSEKHITKEILKVGEGFIPGLELIDEKTTIDSLFQFAPKRLLNFLQLFLGCLFSVA